MPTESYARTSTYSALLLEPAVQPVKSTVQLAAAFANSAVIFWSFESAVLYWSWIALYVPVLPPSAWDVFKLPLDETPSANAVKSLSAATVNDNVTSVCWATNAYNVVFAVNTPAV